MFKPKYSITHHILNNLVNIAAVKAVLDNAYLVPKWEVALRREALIKNAHASTAIEGNPLSLEQVSELERKSPQASSDMVCRVLRDLQGKR